MIEAAVFVMQLLSALVVIAGGVLTLTHVREQGVAAYDSISANDFLINHRRVLAFARFATHH